MGTLRLLQPLSIELLFLRAHCMLIKIAKHVFEKPMFPHCKASIALLGAILVKNLHAPCFWVQNCLLLTEGDLHQMLSRDKASLLLQTLKLNFKICILHSY